MVKRFLHENTLTAAAPPAAERAYFYGDGVFETLKYIDGQLPLWALHTERLLQSCEILRLPVLAAELAQRIELFCHLLRQSNLLCGVIKIVVSRCGEGQRGCYLPQTAAAQVDVSYRPLPTENFRQRRVQLVAAPQPLRSFPALAGLKHLSRLDYICAELSLGSPVLPQQELLLFDENQQVIETMHHNIFFSVGGKLHTPRLECCGVNGVMRRWLMSAARELGLSLRQGEHSREVFDRADEVFLCNAVQGIVSVAEFEQQKFTDYSVATTLQRSLQQKFKFYES